MIVWSGCRATNQPLGPGYTKDGNSETPKNATFFSLKMNSVPVVDVLPWGDTAPQGGRTILICDSVETDGRFLLYTLASQCLSPFGSNTSAGAVGGSRSASAAFRRSSEGINRSRQAIVGGSASVDSESNSGNVLWLGCGANTNEQIRAAMKKIGCDVSPPTNKRINTSTIEEASRFKVIPIITEIEQMISKGATDGTAFETYGQEDFYETYLKQTYQKAKEWKKSCLDQVSEGATLKPCLVIIDNVSQLANLFGSKLVYSFVLQLRSLLIRPNTSSSTNPFSFTILCSNDMDQEYYLATTNQEQSNKSVTGAKHSQYIGAGGRGVLLTSPELALLEQRASYELSVGEDNDFPVWERTLVELADGIVDVTPLPSGFARDIMGRLVFTERKGGLGWIGDKAEDTEQRSKPNPVSIGTSKFSSQIVNFSCTEGGVRAIRLRA